MTFISKNLKYLRRENNLTQEQFAQRVGVNRPAIGAYEEGRAEPKLATLQRIGEIFGLPIDTLVAENLEARGEDDERFANVDIKAKRLRVLSVTVDGEDNENVELVGQKASAGYTNGLADPEYIQELPKIYLPMLSGGTHRAFEIQGDSMLPLESGSIVVGQFVENWHDIRSGKTYVVVTAQEGTVYKRVQNRIYEKGVLELISDNTAYDPYEVPVEDVMEVWEVKMFISDQIPEPEPKTANIDHLSKIVMDLQQQVSQLKGGTST